MCKQDAAPQYEHFITAALPVHALRGAVGAFAILLTLAIGALFHLDVLRLWQGPPAGVWLGGTWLPNDVYSSSLAAAESQASAGSSRIVATKGILA